MIKTVLTPVTTEVPDTMTCDRCDRTEQIWISEDGRVRSWECDFFVLNVLFGYFSQNHEGKSMDGDQYQAVICDRCFLPAMTAAGVKLTRTSMFPEE